jgi:hypothetical protein
MRRRRAASRPCFGAVTMTPPVAPSRK